MGRRKRAYTAGERAHTRVAAETVVAIPKWIPKQQERKSGIVRQRETKSPESRKT
jgi:hypothetical protein